MSRWYLVTSISTVLRRLDSDVKPELTLQQEQRGYQWKAENEVKPFYIAQYEAWSSPGLHHI